MKTTTMMGSGGTREAVEAVTRGRGGGGGLFRG